MNFLTTRSEATGSSVSATIASLFIRSPSLPKPHHPVRPDAGVHELAEAGNLETRRQQVGLDAAAQSGGDTDNHLEAVLLAELGPQLDQIAVVGLWLRQPVRVVDAIVIEEHAIDFMALRQRRLGELVGGVRRLVGKRPFVDQ